jgi:hypothetical protein
MKTRYIIKVETFDLASAEIRLAGYASREVEKAGHLTADAQYAISFGSFTDACDYGVHFREGCPEPLKAHARFPVVARQSLLREP